MLFLFPYENSQRYKNNYAFVDYSKKQLAEAAGEEVSGEANLLLFIFIYFIENN